YDAAGCGSATSLRTPRREAQPFHSARGDDALRSQYLHVETDGVPATPASGTGGVGDEVEAPHDDTGHLRFERLRRCRLEEAQRGVAAIHAVLAGARAAAADHRLD